jgi:hypothetical protein
MANEYYFENCNKIPKMKSFCEIKFVAFLRHNGPLKSTHINVGLKLLE